MRRPARSSGAAALGVLAAALAAAGPVPAAVRVSDVPGARPELDDRAAERAPVPRERVKARAALEQRLGSEGVVETDRPSGALRFVGRTDGPVHCAEGDPADVALSYVRSQRAAFGLGEADLDALRLAARYESHDGVTHVTWLQTSRGIAAYDSSLSAHVTRRGCVLNVSGAPVAGLAVPSTEPALAAGAALGAARRDAGRALAAPPRGRQAPGPERRTAFADGESARLVVFGDHDADRLAWRVQARGGGPFVWDTVIDARSGEVLARHSLTSFAGTAQVYDRHPGAPAVAGATPGARRAVDLAADTAWLNDTLASTRLAGNNAHAYADLDDSDTAGAGENVPADPGGDWAFPHDTSFAPPGQSCPPPGCTWSSANTATKAVNRAQATTQLHYYVNRFHDHLLEPPIGFDAASHNFQRFNPAGVAGSGDRVLAEANDGGGTNNANFTTPPDGQSGRMQQYFFTNPSVNSSDDAEVVYHEYAHGLTGRLVNNGLGGGLTQLQPRSMGEGWSDWYALDFLVGAGYAADTAAPGELDFGAYVDPGGIRTQPTDCPVGGSAPACPGTGPAGPGGYTLGDLGRVSGNSVHANGEIWAQTLWDLRAAVGSAAARELVTGGLRLSPVNPSYVDMRNAILQADVVAGGARSEQIWGVFAARGMGYSASATPSATAAVEDFSLPPVLAPGGATLTDPEPDGDGDGVLEPGESARLAVALSNPDTRSLTGVSGTLGSGGAGLTIDPASASWADLPGRASGTGSPPFGLRLAAGAACGATLALTLAVATDQGALDIPLTLGVGHPILLRSGEGPRAIPDGAGAAPGVLTASVAVPAAAATISDLDVVIEDLRHTFVGDLDIRLTSPSGTTVTLLSRPGAGVAGARGNDLLNVVLDDEAAAAVDTIPDVNPPGGYTGRYRPDQPLSAFDGQSRAGTWTLRVADVSQNDTGTLNSWSLTSGAFDCSDGPAPPPVDLQPPPPAPSGGGDPPAADPPPVLDGPLAPLLPDAPAGPVPPPTGPSNPSNPSAAVRADLSRSPRTVTANRDGAFTFTFTATPGAEGTASFSTARAVAAQARRRRARVLRLGSARFRAPADGRVRTRIRLSRSHESTLRRLRSLPVRAVVTVGARRVERALTLRAPRR